MLVTKLMEAIRGGGEAAQKAALILGLLLERERVLSSDAQGDSGVEEVLREEYVGQRLSRAEVWTAIEELSTYIKATSDPHPRIVWALTRSYNPITMPVLIDLLDRVVADPSKEQLAYQALSGITSFYNDQSLAAIERAAQQGHGEVKRTAEKYLQLFAGLRGLYVWQADKTFDIDGYVYRIQRRPAHRQIVINQGYQGIRSLDVVSGKEVRRVDFTEGYAGSGVITGWCFQSDGKAALILNENDKTASLLALESGARSYDLPYPEGIQTSDLRYVWDNDSFWMTNGISSAFFNLQWDDDRPYLVRRTSVEARRHEAAWRRALDRIQSMRSRVVKVVPDKHEMIFHDYAKDAEVMGVVNWEDQTLWSIRAMEYVSDLAFTENTIFVLHQFEAYALDDKGAVKAVYPAPQGFYYTGIDTLPRQSDQPAELVVSCCSQTDSQVSRIGFYTLE